MSRPLLLELGAVTVLGLICAAKWLAERRRARREWRKFNDEYSYLPPVSFKDWLPK